eukprot:7602815-Lingulodinium_polyedra.AAC.1
MRMHGVWHSSRGRRSARAPSRSPRWIVAVGVPRCWQQGRRRRFQSCRHLQVPLNEDSSGR